MTAIAEKKYNNEIAVHYGLVASLLRAEDYKRAVEPSSLSLEKIAPPHPMIEGMAGPGADAVRRSSRPRSRATKRRSSRYPGKMQLVYDYPEALLKDNQPAKAAAFLAEQLQRFPGDGPCTSTARRPTPRSANSCSSTSIRPSIYAWQGNLRAAVSQLELAVKAGDGDFYQLSVAESRLRAVRQELAEQQKRAGRRAPGLRCPTPAAAE